MIRHLNTSVRMTIASVILLGLIYPLVMTGIAQAIFPRQANGSLISINGKLVGSSIIGQLWTKPQYFHGRPSAAGKGYDPTATGGTNFGPTSKKLIDATKATIAALKKQNPDASGPPPMDLVTSSGSGIDPQGRAFTSSSIQSPLSLRLNSNIATPVYGTAATIASHARVSSGVSGAEMR